MSSSNLRGIRMVLFGIPFSSIVHHLSAFLFFFIDVQFFEIFLGIRCIRIRTRKES